MPRLRQNKLVVMLDDHELQQLRTVAGLVPLSTWARAQLTGKEVGAETLIPLLQKSIENSKKVSKATSSTRGKDAQVQQAVPESPSNYPAPVDMSKILPEVLK